ncbi:MAG: hypothetical protein ACRDWI_00250 [Jiangellaceae bacterium]
MPRVEVTSVTPVPKDTVVVSWSGSSRRHHRRQRHQQERLGHDLRQHSDDGVERDGPRQGAPQLQRVRDQFLPVAR